LDEDDEEDDASEDILTDDEQVVFSEDVPCPRFCQCSRNVNSYLVPADNSKCTLSAMLKF